MTLLRKVLSHDLLRDYAGDAAFMRGVDYYTSETVGPIEENADAISARVKGTETYVSRIFLSGGVIDYDCTCPVGDRGDCCKHVVALGLTWLADESEADRKGERKSKGKPKSGTRKKTVDLRAWLAGLESSKLVDLLYDAAMNDDVLHAQLMNRALAAQATPDVSTLKKMIRESFSAYGFVDYRRMRDFIQRAMTVPDLLDDLRKLHPAEAAELALYALQRGIKAFAHVDDSDGSLGDVLRDVAEIHLDACRDGKPEGVDLARELFRFQLQDEWEFLAFEDYAPLLGKDGLAEYRRLAEAEWKKVPACGPKDEATFSSRSEYFAITRIMETLEKHSGDVDALIAVKARDLSSQYAFVQIAELLQAVKREDEALNWAERGVREFEDPCDERLLEFVLAAYRRSKRHDEATVLAFRSFAARPMLESYRRLQDTAKRSKDWPARRKAAWHLLDEKLSVRKPKRSHWEMPDMTASLRVEILLWENDIEAALREANAHGCTDRTWRQLAKACEKSHPAEAAEIYRSMIDGIVNRRSNDAYAEAAELVAKIGSLMKAQGEERKFGGWKSELMARHRQKRNFMKALDALIS